MVKSKKMSKTSIAVIVLAILLVLSLCLGITGAWFTDQETAGSNSINMKFGTVNYTEFAAYTKVHNKTLVDSAGKISGETGFVSSGAEFKYPAVTHASNAEQDNGTWLIEANTRIATGISFGNASTVETYYVLRVAGANAAADKYYVIDETTGLLIDVTAANAAGYTDGHGKLDVGEYRNIALTFTLAQAADNGSDENIWVIAATSTQNSTDGAQDIQASVNMTGCTAEVAYNETVDLGLNLFNYQFELRVVQAANVENAQAALALLKSETYNHYPTV